ncbi:unnamed protein product [Pleuronectes platessa]|uniref:Uncharacterized protein n=1 Tax=Pleuronectes platessa TaxID=8262 RepID=A0A9N7V2V9_PLEPL|nr:unnamed protein product [Pleuronectes platessa]
MPREMCRSGGVRRETPLTRDPSVRRLVGLPWSTGVKQAVPVMIPPQGTDVIYKKGECTAKPVKADATFHYLDNLLDLIFHELFQLFPSVNEVLKISIPEDLSAKYEKPDKQEVIASYVSIREHSAYWSTTQEGRTTLILRPR